jgi:hypothetical protein
VHLYRAVMLVNTRCHGRALIAAVHEIRYGITTKPKEECARVHS